jgi:transmembrane sensor
VSLSPELREWLRRLGAAEGPHVEALAPLDEARERFLSAEVSPRSSKNKRYFVAAAAVALLGVGGYGVSALSREAPLEARVHGSALVAEAWIDSRARRLPVAFSDGSEVTLEPESRARIVELDRNGAVMALESGEAHAQIVPTGRAQWRFKAGPYTVRVTGTEFSVRFDPVKDLLRLELHHGSVVVSGCALGEARPLRAGEVLTSSCHDGRFEIARGAVAANAQPAAKPAEVEPAVPAPLAPAPSAKSPSTKSGGRTPPAAVGPPEWEALARAGQYKKAWARVAAVGFEAECEHLDADRLALLADVARFGGSSEQALGALSTLRRRFPGSSAAANAGFAIARIHFDQRAAYADAARWFRTYLKEQPRGPLAREAQGRLMEALVRTGSHAEARSLAVTYLEHNPHGPYARLARSLTKP